MTLLHKSLHSFAVARRRRRDIRSGRDVARVAGTSAILALLWSAAAPLLAQRVSAGAGIDSSSRADSAALTVDTVLTFDEALDRARHVSPEVARQNGAVRSARSGEHVALGAEQALLEARSAHVSASVALGRLTGIGGRVGAREEDSSVVRPLSVPEDAVLAEIERTSPDVRAAEATAVATSAGVSSARSHYQPYISAAGGYSYLRQQPEVLNDGGTWVARIGLSYPLFDGFVRSDEVTRARADEETATTSSKGSRCTSSATSTARTRRGSAM